MYGAISQSSSPNGAYFRRRRPNPSNVPPACSGLFLKEHGTKTDSWGGLHVDQHPLACYPAGTEVEGTFRVSGSSKRMGELQAIFEAPPKVCFPAYRAPPLALLPPCPGTADHVFSMARTLSGKTTTSPLMTSQVFFDGSSRRCPYVLKPLNEHVRVSAYRCHCPHLVRNLDEAPP
jgi:hypothetical protein